MYGENKVEVSVHCWRCHKDKKVLADPDDVARRKQYGISAQDAFASKDGVPYLSPAERELFISGTCGECWNEMFSLDDGKDLTAV